MPSRSIPFVNLECYHVINRGVAQIPIFTNKVDYKRFINTMLYYKIEGPKPRFSLFSRSNNLIDFKKRVVEIICYCLMPNHFHILLQQQKEGGVTEFVSKLSNSYTKYFNTKNKRSGPLFQGEFKAVHIETDNQLIHLSRYIHLNPLVGFVTKNLETYHWTSYLEYAGKSNNNTCSKELVLSQFKSPAEYSKFVLDQEDYAKKLEVIKHQTIDQH